MQAKHGAICGAIDMFSVIFGDFVWLRNVDLTAF